VKETISGKGLEGIVVSDGLYCVRTGKDGTFEIPGRQGARFIFVSVPSGWSTNTFYLPAKARNPKYEFKLDKNPLTAGKGCSFVHITDSEINEANPSNMKWIKNVKEIADQVKAAFVVHTGDICARGGMVGHLMMMNHLTMERPMHYCVGNHDLINGSCGEEVFEALFGPCWYSFEAGGIHFCVTPMGYGDYPPSYSIDEVRDWLKNDLAQIPKDMPVVIFNHMLWCYTDPAKAGAVIGRNQALDLRTICNLKGFVYGHVHDTVYRKHNGIAMISSAPPVGGGVDMSPACARVISVDEKGGITATARYGTNEYPWKPTSRNVLWETKLDGAVMFSTPIEKNGKIYLGTVDDGGHNIAEVCALDAKTGKVLWKTTMKNSVKNRLLLAGGGIVAADIEGNLTSLDLNTGAVRWTYSLPFNHVVMNSAPALTPDGKTIVFGLVRYMAAVDAETGKEKWMINKKSSEGVPQRFAIDSERIYGISSWDGIYAFSLKDGKEIWRIKDFGGTVQPGADPILIDNRLYVFLNNTIREIEPSTGKELRKKTLAGGHSMGVASGRAYVTEDLFVVGTNRTGVIAIDRKKFEVVWRMQYDKGFIATSAYIKGGQNAGNVSPIRLSNGSLCAPAVDGTLRFFRLEDGKETRKESCSVPYLAGAVEVPGEQSVVVADFGGNVRAYKI
jgi:outer membrane protein assembly factor BamB